MRLQGVVGPKGKPANIEIKSNPKNQCPNAAPRNGRGSPEDPCGVDVILCERYRSCCVLRCILHAGASVFKQWRVMTTRIFLQIPRATLIEDKNVAHFKSDNVRKPMVVANCK